jgi:lysophospholipase L1-like esterase
MPVVRVAALGDSLSCGEGVGLSVPAAATWPARVTACVPGGRLLPLAAPGARVRDVLATQVQRAVTAEPHVVTLLVGLNDVSRAGWSPRTFAVELRAVLGLLAPTGAAVLLGRLHDPSRLVPLPAPLRRVVRGRVAAVNEAIDAAAAAHPRVRLLDLATVDGLLDRRAWDVDRLHPNAAGHASIAAAAVRALEGLGMPVVPAGGSVLPAAPGPVAEAQWLLRSGLPWLAGHVPSVVLPAVAAVLGR